MRDNSINISSYARWKISTYVNNISEKYNNEQTDHNLENVMKHLNVVNF